MTGLCLVLLMAASLVQRWRHASAVERRPLAPMLWMGTATLGLNRDLGAEDYTDFELWKRVTPNNLLTESLTYAVLSEVGMLLDKTLTGESDSYYGLIDRNGPAWIAALPPCSGGSADVALRRRRCRG